jgi:hypothetical protein
VIALRIAIVSIDLARNRSGENVTDNGKAPMTIDRNTLSAIEVFGTRTLLKAFCVLAAFGIFIQSSAMAAQPLSSEPAAGQLRLGQRVKVDDGTCPAGQIKEVSGTKMTSTGVVPARKCVPRVGPKQK